MEIVKIEKILIYVIYFLKVLEIFLVLFNS